MVEKKIIKLPEGGNKNLLFRPRLSDSATIIIKLQIWLQWVILIIFFISSLVPGYEYPEGGGNLQVEAAERRANLPAKKPGRLARTKYQRASYPDKVMNTVNRVVPSAPAGDLKALQIDAILRDIMLPGVFYPPRYKGAGDSDPTAVACLASSQKVNWDISNYPEFNPQLQHLLGTDMMVVVTKDPTAALILYDPALTTNRLVVYNWVNAGQNTDTIYQFPIDNG